MWPLIVFYTIVQDCFDVFVFDEKVNEHQYNGIGREIWFSDQSNIFSPNFNQKAKVSNPRNAGIHFQEFRIDDSENVVYQ